MSILDSLVSNSLAVGNAIVGALDSITGTSTAASVAADNRDPNRSRPRQQGQDPTKAIDQSSNTSILSFPADRPKYYMSFGFQDYARPSMFEGLSSQGITDYICLPFPNNLIDSSSFNYTAEDGSMVIDAVLPKLRGLRDSWSTGGVDPLTNFTGQAGSLIDAIGEAAVGTGVKKIKDAVSSVITKAGGNGNSVFQTLGIADNPFQTVAFKGADFKSHDFTWRLTPRNAAESQTLRNIVDTFKKAAHPELLVSVLGGFYKYPDIVWVKFNPEAARNSLYTFKPCVITRFVVNWAPEGRLAFFNDSAPVAVDITIQLQEIELWRGGSGDGTLGSGTISTGDFNNIPSPTVRNLGQV